jgi:hypothetical protein
MRPEYVGFKVQTAMNTKISVFCDMGPCRLVYVYCFGGIDYLHFHGTLYAKIEVAFSSETFFYHEDGSNTFL